MNDHQFEKNVKKQLLDQTDEMTHLKEDVWNNISSELFSSSTNRPNNRTRKGFVIGLTAAVVAAILFIGLLSEDQIEKGQAMFQSLRELFIEEKKEEIELEGQKEDSNVRLEANEELRYVIYIDEDRYQMKEGEESDRIETIEPLPEELPDVYMEITRIENTTTEEVISQIKEAIAKDEEMELHREESVTTPIKAKVVQSIGLEYTDENGVTGLHWDTPTHRYYITEADNGQVFVIKQAYFLEAEEGHGARFHYMLESFEVVK
ncbi:hypothetical protein [Oceanobacillus halophilus]|uniref:DUF4367 domain-containing protein n=1 Tax=Oceanobacillus halophilus TaxID=930130 RepID=A0A495A221_9BACI|nr:hypothetical protein [Oceanobacillus halophilus]RKQ33463.1 hypothetical protein D8M06_09645 [Oceanobacillus halophilus]